MQRITPDWMERPYQIRQPAICRIDASPSSLGTIESYLAIYCLTDFPSNGNQAAPFTPDDFEQWIDSEDVPPFPAGWLQRNQRMVGDLLEFAEERQRALPIFPLHVTCSTRSDPATILEPTPRSQFQFQRTTTTYDSGMMAHCLAFQWEGESIRIRGAQHCWAASEDSSGPTDFSTMNLAYGDRRYEVVMGAAAFREVYLRAWSDGFVAAGG